MASEVTGKPPDAVPEIRLCAAQLREEVRKYYHNLGIPIAPEASDVADLAENLASILAPLYEDIHATFVTAPKTTGIQPQLVQNPAQS